MKWFLALLLLPLALHAQNGDRETKAARALREQADENVIAQLVKNGADISKPHDLEHHFVASSKKSVDALAALGVRLGYRPINPTEGTTKEGKRYWTIDLARKVVPAKENVFAESRKMTMIAHQAGAEYDGWGCELEK